MTDAQTRMLAEIVAEYAEANAAEIARWGTPLTGIAWPTSRTLGVLERKGLVDVTRTTHTTETLRRGAYGRWLGGSNRRAYTVAIVRPRS